MATSTKQDEQDDLIILDDTDDIIEDMNSDKKNLDKELEESEIINLDNEDSNEIIDFVDLSDWVKEITEVVNEDNENKNSDDLSFTLLDEDKQNDVKIEEIISSEEWSDDLSFSMDDNTSTDNVEWLSIESSTEVFDLDHATEQFIAQLNIRKDQISNFIKTNESNISDLEEQIKNLKSKVTDFNWNIKKLNEENLKIDDRINILTWSDKKNTLKK